MSIDHRELVWPGMAWIRARDPIGLETSAIGYDDVPPGIERRRACEALADGAPIREGLGRRLCSRARRSRDAWATRSQRASADATYGDRRETREGELAAVAVEGCVPVPRWLLRRNL
jgi:hypothetical protein